MLGKSPNFYVNHNIWLWYSILRTVCELLKSKKIYASTSRNPCSPCKAVSVYETPKRIKQVRQASPHTLGKAVPIDLLNPLVFGYTFLEFFHEIWWVGGVWYFIVPFCWIFRSDNFLTLFGVPLISKGWLQHFIYIHTYWKKGGERGGVGWRH